MQESDAQRNAKKAKSLKEKKGVTLVGVSYAKLIAQFFMLMHGLRPAFFLVAQS
jgi:hypothetical protein